MIIMLQHHYPLDGQAYGTGSSPSSTSASGKREESVNSEEEAEKERQPTRLELLLAESKFTCSQKKDGYYADPTVGCQVFHYCVSGAKHSWMCPERELSIALHT